MGGKNLGRKSCWAVLREIPSGSIIRGMVKRSVFALLVLLAIPLAVSGDEGLPRVAVAGFSIDSGRYETMEKLAGFIEILEVLLSGSGEFELVSRENLEQGLDELERSAYGFVEQRTAVRMGAWAGADILVTGSFSGRVREGRGLQVEVIDLRRGDLLGQRFFEWEEDGGWEDIAFIQRVAAGSREEVIEAIDYLRKAADKTVIAPLFFTNTSKTRRVDFFEDLFLEKVRNQVQEAEGLRLLTFSRAGMARGEAELVLTGLVDANAEAWERVADIYVWGSIQELDAEGQAFEDVEVELQLHVWQVGREPIVKTVRETVRRLEQVAVQLAEAATMKVEAPKQGSGDRVRREVAGMLRERSDEIQAILDPYGNSRQHPYLQKLADHRSHLLSASVFFDPSDADTQWARLRAPSRSVRQWGASSTMWLGVLNYLDYADKFLSGVTEPDRDFLTRGDAVVTLLLRTANNFDHRTELPLEVRTAWRATLVEEFFTRASSINAAIAQSSDDQLKWYASNRYETWIELLSEVQDDPPKLVALFEELWPVMRQSAERGWPRFNHSEPGWQTAMRLAYHSIGEEKRLDAMIQEARDFHAEKRPDLANLPTSSLRKHQEWVHDLRENRKSRPVPVAPPSPLDGVPEWTVAPVAFAVRPFDFFEGFFTDASPYATTFSASQGTVRSMRWFDDYLWISAKRARPFLPDVNDPQRRRGGEWHQLWRYDPALHEFSLMHQALGNSRKITAFQGEGETIWVATEFDGAWNLNTQSGEVVKFGLSDGLTSRHKFALAAAGGSLFFGGGQREAMALSRLDLASGQWFGLDLGAALRRSETRESDRTIWDRLLMRPDNNPMALPERKVKPKEINMMVAWNEWLMIEAGGFFFYDTRRGDWISPRLVDEEGKRLGTGAINAVAAGDDGFWIGYDGGLILAKPQAGEDPLFEHFRIGEVRTLAVAPGGVWLTIPSPKGMTHNSDYRPHQLSFREEERESQRLTASETTVAFFDKKEGRLTGKFSVAGDVNAVAVSPNRLWLGMRDDHHPLVEVRLNHLEASGAMAALPANESRRELDLPEQRLIVAAFEGDGEMLQNLLLEVAPDVSVGNGWTPLHAAVRNGNANMVFYLLQAGADPDVATEEGLYPLGLAAHYRDWASIHLLIEGGADIDFHGTSPQALPDQPRPVYRSYPPMQSALAIAAEKGFHDLAVYLFEAGASPALADTRKQTALTTAAKRGHWSLVSRLIELGTDPFPEERDNSPLFSFALSQGRAEWVRLLLEWGHDVELGGYRGTTPLMIAAGNGLPEVVSVLLEHGADVNAVGREEETAVSRAVDRRNYEIALLLLDNGFETNRASRGERLLLTAVAEYHSPLAFVERLLDDGVDVNARDEKGNTPLMIAAEGNHLLLVELLLERGANAHHWNRQGRRAWDLAGHPEVKEVIAKVLEEEHR